MLVKSIFIPGNRKSTIQDSELTYVHACTGAGRSLVTQREQFYRQGRKKFTSAKRSHSGTRVTNQCIGQEDVHKCKIRSHNGTRVTNQRIGQEDVHKCKIRSHSGTRVTNQRIGQEDVHKCKIRSHSETRATNQRIGQEDVHKCKYVHTVGPGSQTSI